MRPWGGYEVRARSRSTHPGALFAGRELRLEVIALQLGISPHSRGHAEKLLKKSLAKDTEDDYYKTLGVERNASIETIKKAFKKKALECHPDKHANSTKEVKEENEKKMKELSQAYR